MASERPGFGIYIHWPFCAAKCPYCDFNSHVRKSVDHEEWCAALLTDLKHQAEKTEGREVTSIFFGGGTPSLMDPATVGALIDEVSRIWHVANDLEVSLEANPTSVEADRFRAFRLAGVNRVSMGIQALNDPDLKALGRMHSAKEAMNAFDVARSHFERISFDLIYARQGQSALDWEKELNTALEMAVDHLSLYQLTIEAGTRFGDLYDRNMLKGLPSANLGAELFEITQDLCADHGMAAYEVSNHARADSECRHNLTYWRYEPYLGIGPGAHGRNLRGNQRFETVSLSNPEAWLRSVQEKGSGVKTDVSLSEEDTGTEYALMCLRLSEGLSLEKFKGLSGRHLNTSRIDDLISQELAFLEGDRLKTTSKGRPVLNAILAELL